MLKNQASDHHVIDEGFYIYQVFNHLTIIIFQVTPPTMYWE